MEHDVIRNFNGLVLRSSCFSDIYIYGNHKHINYSIILNTMITLIFQYLYLLYTVMEVTGPSRRHWSVSYKSTFWPLGTMYTSLIAYYLQDWSWIQLAGSIPCLIVGLIYIP